MTADELDPEMAVLGAAMSGYGDVGELLEMLDPADFYSPFHEQVWQAIARVHEAGQVPTPVSVRLALGEEGAKFDPIRLVDMVSVAPVFAQAPWHAGQVLVASGKRKIGQAAARLHQLATSGSTDLEVLREEARQAVDDATQGRALTEARTLAQVLPGVLDIAQHGRAKALGTGWPDVDRLIGGLAPGRLVVVGARPGIGKSLMGANLALHFAHNHQHAVLFASLEMDAEEVGQRLLANHARVNLTNLMEGRTTSAEWEQIAPKAAEVEAMPLRILDDPAQTVTSIRREARKFQRQRDDLALIVVDYLQLMGTRERKNVNRAEALGEVSRGLKLLARESGACVVAMAQVNREAVKSAEGRPRISDLRESGAIEADADVVILLHQTDDMRLTGDLEVIVDKNRHGPRGQATLRVYGHYARLANVAFNPTKALA